MRTVANRPVPASACALVRSLRSPSSSERIVTLSVFQPPPGSKGISPNHPVRDDRRGVRHRARIIAPQPCIRRARVRDPTMMQPCASAAKLLAAVPFCIAAMEAIIAHGFATSDRLGGWSDMDVPTSAETSGSAPTLPPCCRSAVG
jgi:hypothetical protein